jgi:hypothetical protein
MKYAVSRGTCVKKTFDIVKEGVDFSKYFEVREVR